MSDKNPFNIDQSKILAWAGEIVEKVKNALVHGSAGNAIRDEVGAVLGDKIGEGLKKNSKKAVSAFASVKKELDYIRELDIIDDTEYYARLEEMRDKYFKKGSENWVRYSAEVYSYQKELLEKESKNLTDIFDNVSKYADKRFDEIRKKQAALYEDLSSYGGIYSKNTVTMNGKRDTYYSTRDLDADITAIKTYASNFSKLEDVLEKSGIGKPTVADFLDRISRMDVGAAVSFTNSLLSKSKSDIFSYVSLWGEKTRFADGFSESVFKEEAEGVADEVAALLKSSLESAGYEIPESFFDCGVKSSESFGAGFIGELDNQFRKISEKLTSMPGLNLVKDKNVATNITNYNIVADNPEDIVEKIRMYDTVKGLLGE